MQWRWQQLLGFMILAGGVVACEERSLGPARGGGSGLVDTGSPSTATVTVGNFFFQSDRNESVNPAVDTVAVGGRVTWTWVDTGDEIHSVRSLSSPGFGSSAVLQGAGATFSAEFPSAGTFEYDCAVHGTLHTGIVVVR